VGLFGGLRKSASSVHSRRQSQYYRRIKRDLARAKVEKEKVHLIQQATREAQRTKKELKRLQPLKGIRRLKFVGDLRQFAGHIPSDTDLNQSIFGAPSPKRPTATRKDTPK
jgi:hypothetical protein